MDKEIKEIARQICSNSSLSEGTVVASQLPSRSVVIEVLESLRKILFSSYLGGIEAVEDSIELVSSKLIDRLDQLRTQILRGLLFSSNTKHKEPSGRIKEQSIKKAEIAINKLLYSLPQLQRMGFLDVEAAYEGDPAATSREEVVFSYPGVQTIFRHRIAHQLYQSKIPLIPRILSEYAHSETGIEIHPGAQIGERFFIDHGTGVVIGETCKIGNNVRIYQGATLGAKSFPLDKNGQPIKGVPRHPIVEDNVIIYSGATILGRTILGKGAIIGANAWVTRDVMAGAIVTRYHGDESDLRLLPY